MNLKHKSIALLVTIISSSSFAGNNPDSEYFRHLMFRESPFAPYKGIHPISQAEASSVAHYKFSYNNDGKVISIAHQIGDEIINNNGNWDTFVWFSPKVTIEYSDDGEIHRYFNADNEQVQTHGKVYTAKYKHNNQGMRTSLKFFDKQNAPSENAWNANRYEWSVDEESRIVEKRFSLNNELVSIRPEFKFYETRLDYDENGVLQFVYNYGKEGKPANNDSGAGIDRIYYDLAGNFQRWQVFSKDGKPVAGNRPMVHVGEHLYDQYGNKIGLRGFDIDGTQMTFSWGDYSTKTTYDRFGNNTSNRTFKKDGQLNSSLSTTFSSDGIYRELISMNDEAGKPKSSPHLAGAAAIKYEYEPNSKKISKRIKLDESLQPMSE